MGDVLGEGVGVLWMIWMWPKWSFFFRQKSWTSVWRGSDSPCPWGASRCPSSSSLSTSPSPTASSSSVSSPSSTASPSSPSLTLKWFLRWLSATQGCQQWITRSTGVFGFHNLDHYLEAGFFKQRNMRELDKDNVHTLCIHFGWEEMIIWHFKNCIWAHVGYQSNVNVFELEQWFLESGRIWMDHGSTRWECYFVDFFPFLSELISYLSIWFDHSSQDFRSV